jgi:chromosome segregation ATPase
MVEYNKEGPIKKGGRLLFSGGPRDKQLKLSNKVSTPPIDSSFLKSLEDSYKDKIESLEKLIKEKEERIEELYDDIDKLNEIISQKDKAIVEITKNIGNIKFSRAEENSSEQEIEQRPGIDNVYIDPSKDRDYEGNVKVKEIKAEKPNVMSSVDKLRSVLGKK